jgi:hypothetical protein
LRFAIAGAIDLSERTFNTMHQDVVGLTQKPAMSDPQTCARLERGRKICDDRVGVSRKKRSVRQLAFVDPASMTAKRRGV